MGVSVWQAPEPELSADKNQYSAGWITLPPGREEQGIENQDGHSDPPNRSLFRASFRTATSDQKLS